jgi:predicted 3-demethylubiquinone-9 3-methyltransferase (glyoxalase superfamily)
MEGNVSQGEFELDGQRCLALDAAPSLMEDAA